MEDSDGDERRATLLSVCGKKAYSLLKKLYAPKKPVEKSYQELCDLIRDHCNPAPSEIVQRFKFRKRERASGETVMEYIAGLRQLAADCNFGSDLDNNMRDQIVCGINNATMQREMLRDRKLTLEKAISIARSQEETDDHVRQLHQCKRVRSSSGGNSAAASEAGAAVRNAQVEESQQNRVSERKRRCYRCWSETHLAHKCFHRQSTCSKCRKVGHLSRVCRSDYGGSGGTRLQNPSKAVGSVEEFELAVSEEYQVETVVFRTDANEDEVNTGELREKRSPILINASVNGTRRLSLELDTGAAVSLISIATFNEVWPTGTADRPVLMDATVKLRSYTGGEIKVCGGLVLNVAIAESTEPTMIFRLPLLVVEGTGPSLCGRDWLSVVRLEWNRIMRMEVKQLENIKLQEVLQRFESVFDPELGTYTGEPVDFCIDHSKEPKFCAARPVPYALREEVEVELDRMEREGIVEKVTQSRWASPIVTVRKSDGGIRICGDYKRTLNMACQADQYPLPRVEDMFAELAGYKRFTKVDLSRAYLLLTLSDEAKQYTTINTHRGLYRFTRMPFGVNTAPAVFQRVIENTLRGLRHVLVRADDILVSGLSDEEHLENLVHVLGRLEQAGLKAKLAKCLFMSEEVPYMGYLVNEKGQCPIPEKTNALLHAPAPTNVSEVKSYLGMLNYYGRFLPDLSTVLEPIHELLRKGHRWAWTVKCDEAFLKTKQLLCSAKVLTFYDPAKPIHVACDASPYGVGAVLSPVSEEGTELPVAYASRTLTNAERNYSQFDREALAVVFAMGKFHNYLFGRAFTVITDHKPLLGVFSKGKAIPLMASSRVIRWAVKLLAYDFILEYRPGSRNQNADCLSRLPYGKSTGEVPTGDSSFDGLVR